MYGGLRYIELVWWMTEHARAAVVHAALHDKLDEWKELVAWTFKHTRFDDPAARRLFCEAVESVPQEIATWLAAKVMESRHLLPQ